MLKILLISIPILFFVGSIFHFAYDLSGKNKLVGLFAPVNESIFEHSKLLLVPLTLFWGILYIFLKGKINIDNYFFAMITSIVISILTMISFYYTYKGILGTNKEILNVLDLLISLIIGQIVANHVYIYAEKIPCYISITILFILFFLFIYLTFNPIKIPLFYDQKNKIYGFNKPKNKNP